MKRQEEVSSLLPSSLVGLSSSSHPPPSSPRPPPFSSFASPSVRHLPLPLPQHTMPSAAVGETPQEGVGTVATFDDVTIPHPILHPFLHPLLSCTLPSWTLLSATFLPPPTSSPPSSPQLSSSPPTSAPRLLNTSPSSHLTTSTSTPFYSALPPSPSSSRTADFNPSSGWRGICSLLIVCGHSSTCTPSRFRYFGFTSTG